MINFEDMINSVRVKNPYVEGKEIDPSKLIFEERVKMSCFNCGKYSTNWKCPGNMPKNIDYEKMVKEFENGAFIILKLPFTEANYNDVRTESSVQLHKIMLNLEKYLWDHDAALVLSFIGGSCKLCKNGCGRERCNNPYKSRSPVEAIGINVIKSAALYDIPVSFPPEKVMMRLGLILW